ncbi:MAG: response regulator [Burkholderiales bacterium]
METSNPKSNERRQHVLVVDDDDTLAKYILSLLRRRGYRASRVASAEAGLAAIAADPPNLLILDHFLPDMSGEDMLEELRATPATEHLPVIYLTTDGSRKRFRKSMTGGADDFLAKPFRARELTDAVEVQLRRHYRRLAALSGAPVSDEDEVARMADALTRMETKLAEASQERWRAQLEVQMIAASVDHRLSERTARLESDNRELKAYDYSVAHELKRPLSGILGYAEVLLQQHGDGLNQDCRLLLGKIERHGRRMSDYIDGLLELTSAGRQTLERTTVDLSALAEEVAHELVVGRNGKPAQLRIPAGLAVDADPVLARVVLENLMSNAIKYSADADPPVVELSAGVRPGEFVISDNGCGFDQARATSLFQPFQRLHDRDRFEGLGIGLATVKRILERHGGTITGIGEAGRGARFHFGFGAP